MEECADYLDTALVLLHFAESECSFSPRVVLLFKSVVERFMLNVGVVPCALLAQSVSASVSALLIFLPLLISLYAHISLLIPHNIPCWGERSK